MRRNYELVPSPAVSTLCFALLASAVLPPGAPAQIPMSSGAYFQNFDSLAYAGTNIPWTNNATLPGWYATVTTYNSGSGSSQTGSLYSYGLAGLGESALCSLASGGAGDLSYGVRLLNDTGFDRTNIVVSYTGEQWRAANAPAQSLEFSY